MRHTITAALIFIPALMLGSLAFIEVGRRIALRRLEAGQKNPDFGVIEGAMFALLGLLIAFTFTGAAERFDWRRKLVVEEVNAIGTAYLRLDLLPPESQSPLRDQFRRYVDSRLAVYKAIPNYDVVKERLAQSAEIQRVIWTEALAAARATGRTDTVQLTVPALNAMFDITTMRTEAFEIHPPLVVFAMLGILVWICSLLAGFGIATRDSRSLLHVFAFTGILSLTVFVIVDYEYPRVGFVNINATDQLLVDLRDSMR
jgi:hypothetical protein